jgi:hypothetical protein
MRPVFVFGSNLAGEHLGGAARYAVDNHNAVWGQAIGLQGTSYAIPTMDDNLRPLDLYLIREYVEQFLRFARTNPEYSFQVTRIGCGIVGYKDSDIAPMFMDSPSNCFLPDEW